MSVEQEIHRYAIKHYGNLISVGKPKFDDKTKTWSAELKSDYPLIIRGDRPSDQKILKFLSLSRLGEIKFGEDKLPIESTTSRAVCIDNLRSFLEMWKERAERIIVEISSQNFARINEAQVILAKFEMIITNLLREEIILEEEIEFYPTTEVKKIRRYLRFLEGLDLVRKTDEGYTYGNLFVSLQRKTEGNVQEFKTAILSHIIGKRYYALKETFGITQLEPFVHVDSCYYRPTLEAEELLYWTGDSIIDRYRKRYGRKSSLRIRHILEKLVSVKALEREDKFYFGNKVLFSQMLKMKDKIADLAPPRA